jgi:hypothetical protein
VCFIVLALIEVLNTVTISGYNFGYFVKLLTAELLPTSEDNFFALLRTWFPTVYDIKFMMRSKVLKGSLQEVADGLSVRSIFYFYGFVSWPTDLAGYANRYFPSSGFRFPPHSLYLRHC